MPSSSVGLILCAVALVCGCDHRKEVAALIEKDFGNLKSGGALRFVEYGEFHTTEWNTRTFHANGIVKWARPWYEIAGGIDANYGMPEIKVVRECHVMNRGIVFQAMLHKGSSGKKDCVLLNLPNIDFMTEQTLSRRFPKVCFIMPDGRLAGAEIDKKRYSENEKNAVRAGDLFAAAATKKIEGIVPQIDGCCAFDYSKENDEALKKHISECTELEETVHTMMDGFDEAFHPLCYFDNFPIESMRSPDVGKSLAAMTAVREKAAREVARVFGSKSKAKDELYRRKRSGVVFVKATQTPENRNAPTPTIVVSPAPVCQPSKMQDPTIEAQAVVGDGLNRGRTIRVKNGKIEVRNAGRSRTIAAPSSVAPANDGR